MKISLLFIIFLITNFTEAALRDLSGLYSFENCSCTSLRCLDPYFYRINQTQNGDFIIYYSTNTIAGFGTTISIYNGRPILLSMKWLPTVYFDTNCTGLWIAAKQSIELMCGDQNRHCTGQLRCWDNTGPCSTNSSTSLNSQYIKSQWTIVISFCFLLLLFVRK